MDRGNSLNLNIAGVSIRMELEQPVAVTDAFRPFLRREEEPQFRAVFRCVRKLPCIPEKVLHEDMCFRVHPDGKGGYLRSFFDAPRDLSPYARATYDYPNGLIQVEYLEKGKHCVSEMSNSFFHLGIEAVMLQKQRLFLHAACVATHLGGLLFSGPSGIGKSTQAQLWCRYRGSRLINGDRTILSRDGNTYRAWGSPYAGSSRCFVNASVPVAAIVMLKQDQTCSLRRLEAGEAFRKIYSGLTVYSWDRNSTAAVCDLALQLVRQIPVFEFSCTADAAAVDYLEKALQGVPEL